MKVKITLMGSFDNLFNHLLQYGDLNSQQKKLIENNAELRTLGKGDFFSEAGKTSKEVAFIVNGILRVLYYNKDGEEITRYFIDEHNWAVDLNSYNLRIPSSEYIQAVLECELIVIDRSALEEFSNTIVHWDSIIAKVTNKALLEKVNRISPMMGEDAKTRYLEFMNRYPSMANRIPLSYLASYIGITKSSLSRIRANL